MDALLNMNPLLFFYLVLSCVAIAILIFMHTKTGNRFFHPENYEDDPQPAR